MVENKSDILKPRDKKIIALVGMMGVGKSTIGSRLARRLGIYFIDSDQEIEDNEERSISDIFADKGEEYFRKVESDTISKIIARDEPMILSLGGGSLVDLQVKELVKKKCVSVWLDCSIETILERTSGKGRPLLQSGNKRAILEELLEKRCPIYQQADIKVNTDRENNVIINNIIEQIKNFIKE